MVKLGEFMTFIREVIELMDYADDNVTKGLASIQVFMVDNGTTAILCVLDDIIKFESLNEAHHHFIDDSKNNCVAFMGDTSEFIDPLSVDELRTHITKHRLAIVYYGCPDEPVIYFMVGQEIFRQSVLYHTTIQRKDMSTMDPTSKTWTQELTDELVDYFDNSIDPCLNETIAYAIPIHLDSVLVPELKALVMSYVM